MARVTLIPETTAAAEAVLNGGEYGSIVLDAAGLAGAEQVSVSLLGGQTPVPYAEGGSPLVLTPAASTTILPGGPNYLISKPATAGAASVGASLARSLASAGVGGGSVGIVSNGVLAPFVTFTRASTATRYNSAGLLETVAANRPRIDYDPATVTRANLLRHSEDFSQSVWAKNNVTVAESFDSPPFPGAKVFKVAETAAAADHSLTQTLSSSTVAGASVFSFYAKPAERSFVRLSSLNEYIDASVNLSTGQISGSGAANVSVELLSGGWVRISLKYNALGVGTVYVYPKTSLAGGTNYAGTAGEGFLMSSPQVERGSTATDYIPTGASPAGDAELRGLLVEEQRTNLLLRSQEFDNAVVWILSGADRISNTSVAPDGTLTAEKLVETAVNASHNVTQNVSLVSGTTYAFSFYAKAAERTVVSFFGADGLSSISGRVNLTTGAVESGTVSVKSVGNGWWRISAVGASTFTGANSVSIQLYNAGGTYLGDGTSGVFLWGAQIEAGAFSTSYIPTVATAQTRAADAVSPTLLSSLGWNSSAGSLFIETQLVGRPASSTNSLFAIRNGAAGANILFAYNNSADTSQVSTFDGSTASIANGPSLVSAVGRRAIAFDSNGKVGVGPFGVSATAYNGAFAPATHFVVEGAWNGWIRSLRYYPRRLSNAQLQALTA